MRHSFELRRQIATLHPNDARRARLTCELQAAELDELLGDLDRLQHQRLAQWDALNQAHGIDGKKALERTDHNLKLCLREIRKLEAALGVQAHRLYRQSA